MENEETPKKSRRGGNHKGTAPKGYLTRAQARERIGVSATKFQGLVDSGVVPRMVFPLHKNGVYPEVIVNELAARMELALNEDPAVQTRVALPVDAPGIVRVLTIRGWKTATAAQRRSWYRKNPEIDFIVLYENEVGGYVHAVPYNPETLEDMMSGKKRSWHVQQDDILPYISGGWNIEPGGYDLYVGVATRTDLPDHTQHLGFRLLAAFLAFLLELRERGVIIKRMHAVSAEPDGQRLCRKLGFVEQPAHEGDLFPRFVLDLETSPSRFARLYREAME